MTSVLLTTNKGNITIELDAEKAPKTVANFLDYVNKGHFSNTIFHRVISNFMVQGGGFEPGMKTKKTGEPIQNEADNGLGNKKGTVAMARTMDPHSASAQFFINVADNGFLLLSATGRRVQVRCSTGGTARSCTTPTLFAIPKAVPPLSSTPTTRR